MIILPVVKCSILLLLMKMCMGSVQEPQDDAKDEAGSMGKKSSNHRVIGRSGLMGKTSMQLGFTRIWLGHFLKPMIEI